MRLSKIEKGKLFMLDGKVFTHDLMGSDGNKKIAVREIESGLPCKLLATTEVELIEDPAIGFAEYINLESEEAIV